MAPVGLQANGIVVQVPGLPRLGPGDARGTAPGLDQHRAEIVRALGCDTAC